MPVKASFDYSVNLLEVTLTNFSIIDSAQTYTYAWDFGDGNTSTDENPVHTYSTQGLYIVTLKVVYNDGSSDVIASEVSREVRVFQVNPIKVEEYINCYLPSHLELDANCKEIYIKHWQLYLQNLVDPHISNEEVYDDSAWPILVNGLIAKLVIHDVFVKASQGALVLSMKKASGDIDESNGETTEGAVKSLKTGPTEAEWHDIADTMSAFFSKGAGEDGSSIFDLMRQEICRLAARLKIYLPMCPLPAKKVLIPKKALGIHINKVCHPKK